MSRSEEAVVEPSILEYARYHGLAIDHRAIHPLQSLTHTPSLPDAQDSPKLFEIDVSCGSLAPERLSVSKEAASLLSSIRETPSGDCEFDVGVLTNPRRVRNLKMELPLLLTDPALDLRDFREQAILDLAAEHLPHEKVDEELDEGLTWPLRYENLYRKFIEESESEKPTYPKEALLYLQNTLSSHQGHDGSWSLEDSLESSSRRKILEPFTPPLLPMSPEVLPFVPSSDVGHFELLSDRTSPTREALHKLDEQIMRADVIQPRSLKREATPSSPDTMPLNYEDIGTLFSPLKGLGQTPSPPVHKRVRVNDYKVDGPLTPLLSEQPPPWKPKSVSFQENLCDIIPDLPPPMGSPEAISSKDIDDFFAETIQPIAEQVDRGIEQEQLQEADATKRVKVPIMDFSRPIAPWNAYINDGKDNAVQKESLGNIKTKHFGSHSWPISRKAEQALTWVAIPAEFARAAVHEEITETSLLQDFIAKPDCLECNTLTWKMDGLRVLDDTESDTETLQDRDFSDATNFESLVWKRTLELQDGAKNLLRSGEEPLEGPFSGFGSIGSFLNIRNQEYKKRKTAESLQFSTSVVPKDNTTSTLMSKSKAIPVSEPKHQTTGPRPPIPTPRITEPLEARPFVVSSTILANIRSSTRLRQLYPSAEIIERDFSRHVGEVALDSKAKAGNVLGGDIVMAQEADIILSPAVGLLWTTLTKVKQRSLPGHSVKSPIKERISRCAPLYENLVVLVGEGLTANEGTKLDGNMSGVNGVDCEATLELTGFCSSLEGVQVIFVGGGEEEILQWTVSLMVKYGVNADVKLLQDETLWELFLRRVGMNAFAAQVILAELKPPELPYDVLARENSEV
ncbi:MAG: hypothetical protein Q9187_002080 [Circinaria calcarea]